MSLTSVPTWIFVAAVVLIVTVLAGLFIVLRGGRSRWSVPMRPPAYGPEPTIVIASAPPDPDTPARLRLREGLEQFERRIDVDPIRFHALWQCSVRVEEWSTLFVYMYSGRRGLEGARADFELRRSASHDRYEDSGAGATVQRGAEITIVPEAPALMFNPPSARILWLEEWHRVEFRMRALASPGSDGIDYRGRVAFFVGPLLIAETALAVKLLGDPLANPVPTAPPWDGLSAPDDFLTETSSSAFRAIFVSYSRHDAVIVDQLERAYRGLGVDYLRDVDILRSGEEWEPSLRRAIDRADVFQLCWSHAAKRSGNVENEWRYALGLNRPKFIRPMCWEQPPPEAPPELKHLNFTFVQMSA